MQAVFSPSATLNLVKMVPGAELPLHDHPHQQIGLVLSGVLLLSADGREHEIGPMSAYVVPGGLPHRGVAGPDGCVVVDAFAPAREDYRIYAAEPRTQ
jgi:quercetin dioxygenase-like cupin family protein